LSKKKKISLFLIYISDQMRDSQQENNIENCKDKNSYVPWSTDNHKLLLLLVDAINRGLGLRDVNESLGKQNVDRIILPRLNVKTNHFAIIFLPFF